MQRIYTSIIAAAALAAAFLPGYAQAARVAGVNGMSGTSGSVVVVGGQHAHTVLVRGAHRGHHFHRVFVVSPLVVSRFGVSPFVVPGFGVVGVPAVAVATGNGFVILNGGFAVNSLNGFTTGSIGPFTTFSNSFGIVPLGRAVVLPARPGGIRVAGGHGVSMAGRR